MKTKYSETHDSVKLKIETMTLKWNRSGFSISFPSNDLCKEYAECIHTKISNIKVKTTLGNKVKDIMKIASESIDFKDFLTRL